MKRLKVLVLGGGNVGKTTCVMTYQGNPPTDYLPTILDPVDVTRTIDDSQVQMTLWESPGHEDYARYRGRAYDGASVILLFYSITSTSSLRLLREELYPEIKEMVPNLPIILVASKVDLREHQPTIESMAKSCSRGPFSVQEGLDITAEFKAVRYMEVCGTQNEGVSDIFEEAARVALASSSAIRKPSCIVM